MQDEFIAKEQASMRQVDENKIVYSPVQPNGLVESCLSLFGACVSCCSCYSTASKQIKEGSFGLVLKNGRFAKKVGPGQYLINPHTESLLSAELMYQVSEY